MFAYCTLRYAPCSQLELSGPADFGVIVADGRVLSRQVAIFNEGTITGEFKIKYSGNKPVTIMPTSGVVKPGHSQMIKVECRKMIRIFEVLRHWSLTLSLPRVPFGTLL
jgi:hypothetical protein